MKLRAILTLLVAVFTSIARGGEPINLPPILVEDSVVESRLASWSYARSGQCEVMTSKGASVAAAIAEDCNVIAAFLRFAHPEAALPENVQIRLILDSEKNPVFGAVVSRSGFATKMDGVGIIIIADQFGERQVKAFRRELVKSGFAFNKSDFPLWYRLGLKNIIAESQIAGSRITIGRPPLTAGAGRFMLAYRGMHNFDRVFQATEDSAEYKDEDSRFLLDRQATAFMHMCQFSGNGRYVESFIKFVKDPDASQSPDYAFQRAFGFDLKALGLLMRVAAQGDYKYATRTFRCNAAPDATSRPAKRSDLAVFQQPFE